MAQGMQTYVGTFPFGEQLREDYLNRDPDYVRKPQRRLKAICERLNVPFLALFGKLDREKHLIEDTFISRKKVEKLLQGK